MRTHTHTQDDLICNATVDADEIESIDGRNVSDSDDDTYDVYWMYVCTLVQAKCTHVRMRRCTWVT